MTLTEYVKTLDDKIKSNKINLDMILTDRQLK